MKLKSAFKYSKYTHIYTTIDFNNIFDKLPYKFKSALKQCLYSIKLYTLKFTIPRSFLSRLIFAVLDKNPQGYFLNLRNSFFINLRKTSQAVSQNCLIAVFQKWNTAHFIYSVLLVIPWIGSHNINFTFLWYQFLNFKKASAAFQKWKPIQHLQSYQS